MELTCRNDDDDDDYDENDDDDDNGCGNQYLHSQNESR